MLFYHIFNLKLKTTRFNKILKDSLSIKTSMHYVLFKKKLQFC